MPVTIPAPGASSSYRPFAASALSSRKALPGSSSRSIRSRTGSLPRSRWRAMERSSPPAPRCAPAHRSARAGRRPGRASHRHSRRMALGIDRAAGSRRGAQDGHGCGDYGRTAASGRRARPRVTSGHERGDLRGGVDDDDAHDVLERRLAGVQDVGIGQWQEAEASQEVLADLGAGARCMLPVTLNGPAMSATRRSLLVEAELAAARHSGGMARISARSADSPTHRRRRCRERRAGRPRCVERAGARAPEPQLVAAWRADR